MGKVESSYVGEAMLETFGKILLVIGLGIIMLGFLLWGVSKLTGGRMLPGDIVIQRPGFTFIFPIVTSIVLSILLTLAFWLIAYLRK